VQDTFSHVEAGIDPLLKVTEKNQGERRNGS